MTKVLIGAADWQVEQWTSSFYPDDLPTEWQLSYYANAYRTTQIDCAYWQAEQRLDELAELLEDCPASFQPVLVLRSEELSIDQTEHFLRWLQQLDDEIGLARLAGVRLSGHNLEQVSLLMWRAAISDSLPIALEGHDDLFNENGQWLADQKISPVWRPGERIVDAQAYWLASFSLSIDARMLASQIGDFLGNTAEENTVCLLVEQGYENIASLQELSTIVQLING